MEYAYWWSRLTCMVIGHAWVKAARREVCDRVACRGRTTRPPS